MVVPVFQKDDAMNAAQGIAGLVGTVVIAGVVANAVSAPRNVDNFMAAEQAALDGQSINQHIAQVQDDVRQQQCETYTRMAEEGWDRAMEQGTADRDAERLDELDRQVQQFCNP